MSCFYPLIGLPTGDLTQNGKPRYMIRSTSLLGIHDISKYKDEYKRTHNGLEPVIIPCGKCIGCRLQYSKQWADRCMLEYADWPCSYFVTLTYDDDHLKNCRGDPLQDGENASLYKKDFQDFMKRLRKYIEPVQIRFFMAGEYGTKTFRPHYHAIIFNLPITDLHFYKRTENGDILYNSPTLSRIWNNGHVVIGEVTWDTCAYTARYTAKKANNYEEFYERWNINPEFTLMSRRPGIGRNYYERNNYSLFTGDFIYIATPTGGKKISTPAYFNRLLDNDDPDLSKQLKEHRKEVMSELEKVRAKLTDKNYIDNLDTQAESLQSKIKSLRRNEI